MDKSPTFILLVIGLLFLLIPTGCSEPERAPFVDDLYFRYKITMYGPMARQSFFMGIKFIEVETGKFEIRVDSNQDESAPLRFEIEGGDLLVDKYGKMENGKYLSITPDQAPVWVPVYNMKKGDKIMESHLREKRHWQEWDVWAASLGIPGGRGNLYFEESTGIYVGSEVSHMGSGMNTILIETNAEGL